MERQKILITGITGTWGRAFTELLKDDHDLIGIDHSEQGVAKFKHDFPGIPVILGNFDDFDFEHHQTDLVIHLAAHKHIGICEKNVYESCLNNVTRTGILFKHARKNKVKILFVSTDKAVEPICVYGSTKMLGEHLAREFGGVVARSGNVIASQGSVMQIWQEAIEKNAPLRLSDPDCERYFILPSAVVAKVWNGYQQGLETIIPDMGEPVRLGDMLDKLLADHGFTRETYPGGITISGLSPIEKMHEKLKWDNEDVEFVQ